jgi:predicted enzyme related to lactoylglutathione lyase
MHKSRLSTFVIDCKVDDFDAAARFWSAALGTPVEAPHADFPHYRVLTTRPGQPVLMMQKVEHESRVHLDIEADDIDAEVARLEALGAKKLEKVRTWVVMEAPSGHRFCVVRPQRGPIGDDGNTWE